MDLTKLKEALKNKKALEQTSKFFKKPESNETQSVFLKKKEKLTFSDSLEKKNKPDIIDNPLNKAIYKISFSEYSTYLQCPHKWFLSYGLKFPGDASEELVFGSAVHNTIENILSNRSLRGMIRDNIKLVEGLYLTKLKEEISSITDLSLLERFKAAWVFPTFYKYGKEILTELNLFERFKEYEVMDVEFNLDDMYITESDEFIVTFKGFIDLVLRHKETGRYLILDWKTSGKPWDIKKKEKDENFYDQLKLYKYFYSKAKNIPLENIDVCFFNLTRGDVSLMKKYEKEFSNDQINEFKNKFDESCKSILDLDIFKFDKAKFVRKNNFCHRCKFNIEPICNDLDLHQVVDISEKEKIK